MANPMIEVRHLKKYFNTPKGTLHAVDDISFRIEKGKTMGVVGESGCGKSTLGRTIIHLLESTDGQIFLDGKDITHVDKHQMHEINERMQIVFQDPYSSLNPRQTVEDVIREPLKLSKRYKTRAEIDAKTDELMKLVGIDERLRHAYPHELDGGRRQRVGIARALSLNPDFIVCDEPVSALDVSIQAQVLNLLQDLQEKQGLTYMFVTHDLSVVRHISDDICVMYLGQLVEKAPTRELFAHTLHPYTKALLSAIPIPSLHNKKERVLLKGELSSPINPKDQCRFAGRCDYCTEECLKKPTPELTEITPGHFVACHRVREIQQIPGNQKAE